MNEITEIDIQLLLLLDSFKFFNSNNRHPFIRYYKKNNIKKAATILTRDIIQRRCYMKYPACNGLSILIDDEEIKYQSRFVPTKHYNTRIYRKVYRLS